MGSTCVTSTTETSTLRGGLTIGASLLFVRWDLVRDPSRQLTRPLFRLLITRPRPPRPSAVQARLDRGPVAASKGGAPTRRLVRCQPPPTPFPCSLGGVGVPRKQGFRRLPGAWRRGRSHPNSKKQHAQQKRRGKTVDPPSPAGGRSGISERPLATIAGGSRWCGQGAAPGSRWPGPRDGSKGVGAAGLRLGPYTPGAGRLRERDEWTVVEDVRDRLPDVDSERALGEPRLFEPLLPVPPPLERIVPPPGPHLPYVPPPHAPAGPRRPRAAAPGLPPRRWGPKEWPAFRLSFSPALPAC